LFDYTATNSIEPSKKIEGMVKNKEHNQSQNTEKLKAFNLFCSKNLKSYFCEICDYYTSKKSDYIIHLSSEKHIKKVAENSNIYNCEICDYYTSKKSNYDKHLSCEKHIKK